MVWFGDSRKKSTSGACHFLGCSLVSWSSKKQNCISLSSTEAEYVAAASCCSQLLWMRQTLKEHGVHCDKVPLLCNNESAIKIGHNPVLHSRTKHIDIRHHFIRDHINRGDIDLSYVPTKIQLADMFTRPLDEARFTFLRHGLNIVDSKSLSWLPCILTYPWLSIGFRCRHGFRGSAVLIHWAIPLPIMPTVRIHFVYIFLLWNMSWNED